MTPVDRNFHGCRRFLVGISPTCSTSSGLSCLHALLRDWADCTRQSFNKYYIDELYAALFMKPLVDGSTRDSCGMQWTRV